jgi:hypothetical protein
MTDERSASRAPDFKQAQDAAAALSTLAIHLVMMNAERAPAAIAPSHLRFQLSCSGVYWRKIESNSVFVMYPYEVTVFDTSDGTPTESANEIGFFTLLYQVVYGLSKPLSTWSDETLEAFVSYYGANHSWPYARAELQAMTAKVGLPALTLPILRMGELPNGFRIEQQTNERQ